METLPPSFPTGSEPVAPEMAIEALERALSHALQQSSYWAERAAGLSEALLAWSAKL